MSKVTGTLLVVEPSSRPSEAVDRSTTSPERST